jgi:hypothetical protein
MDTLRSRGPSCVPSLGAAIPRPIIPLPIPRPQAWARQLFRALIWCGLGFILLLCVLAGWILAMNAFGLPEP